MNRFDPRRGDLIDWVEAGRMPPDRLAAAIDLVGLKTAPADWRGFLDALCLWLGVLFLAAGVIFFFAYNWQVLGRYAKFGMVEAAILAAVAASWRLGIDAMPGKAALLLASLLMGALLALVGQTYQTGADTFELFAMWALVIVPWVLVGRLAALWLAWVALINLAIILYHHTFGGVFGMVFGTERLLWLLFAFNTVALGAIEAAARRGLEWLRERWSPRLLAIASGGIATTLALFSIFGFRTTGAGGALAWLAWMGGAYVFYRVASRDVFVLALGVLSAIVVIVAFAGKEVLRHNEAGSFLLIGMLVIGLSAAGGWWLKSVAAEARS